MKNLLYISLLILSTQLIAQVGPGAGACLTTLDLDDPSTYVAPDCGAVNSAHWSVSNDSCTLGSESVAVTLGIDSVDVTICMTVNPTGNMEANDLAYLTYIIDGVPTIWRTVAGNEFSKVTQLCVEVKVIVGAVMAVQLTYKNNHNSETWRLQNGGMSICYTDANPLPVELDKFTATINDPNVDVEWTTASEINNNYFIVERSEDGVNFDELERVDGAGNSTDAIEYDIVDYSPYIGVSYYRLVQFDYDGTSTTSKIVAVDNKQGDAVEMTVKLFPNPVSKEKDIQIKLEGFYNKEILCSLVDAYGVEIYSFVVLSEFHNTFVINSSALPLTSGVYFVRGSTDESLFSKKIIVQ